MMLVKGGLALAWFWPNTDTLRFFIGLHWFGCGPILACYGMHTVKHFSSLACYGIFTGQHQGCIGLVLEHPRYVMASLEWHCVIFFYINFLFSFLPSCLVGNESWVGCNLSPGIPIVGSPIPPVEISVPCSLGTQWTDRHTGQPPTDATQTDARFRNERTGCWLVTARCSLHHTGLCMEL